MNTVKRFPIKPAFRAKVLGLVRAEVHPLMEQGGFQQWQCDEVERYAKHISDLLTDTPPEKLLYVILEELIKLKIAHLAAYGSH
jgi:hypothetical protein